MISLIRTHLKSLVVISAVIAAVSASVYFITTAHAQQNTSDPAQILTNFTGTWALGDWATSSASTLVQNGIVTTTENSSVAEHYVQQYIDVPSSLWWQFSVEVKPVGARNVQMYILDSNNQSANNLAVQCGLTGQGSVLSQWKSVGAANLVASVYPLADGWYRCNVGGQLSSTTPASNLRLIVYALQDKSTQYLGNGSSGLQLRNPVLSGALPADSCATKAYASCDYVQSLFSMREGYGASATGGLGGDVVTVTNLNDAGPGSLRAAATLQPVSKPVWIRFAPNLSGTITLASQIYLPSNRTVDGRGAAVTLQGHGFNLFGNFNASNDIINNVAIKNIATASDDAISISNGAKGIWIHRVLLSGQGGDGLVDITNGATDVTVDWSKFTDHDKVMIVNSYPTTVSGNSEVLNGHQLDYYDRDKNARVTLHHNVFTSTTQRHPRSVFGKIHMYDNLLTGWSSYGVGSSFRAQTLIEGNIFENTTSAGTKTFLNQVGIDPEPGSIKAVNNSFSGTAVGTSSTPENVSVPPYQYRCEAADSGLKTRLLAGAGTIGAADSTNTLPAFGNGCPVLWTSANSLLGTWTTSGAKSSISGTTRSLIEDTSTGYHMLQQYITTGTSKAQWRLSFEASPLGRNVRIYVFDSNNQSDGYLATQCGLSGTGSIISQWKGALATDLTASVSKLPDGWYKCTISGVPNSNGASALRLVLEAELSGSVTYRGDGTSGLNIRNILLEKSL